MLSSYASQLHKSLPIREEEKNGTASMRHDGRLVTGTLQTSNIIKLRPSFHYGLGNLADSNYGFRKSRWSAYNFGSRMILCAGAGLLVGLCTEFVALCMPTAKFQSS